jgi:hypothetical protein
MLIGFLFSFLGAVGAYEEVDVKTASNVEQEIRHVANTAYGAGTPEAEELFNYLDNAKGRLTINFK